MNNAITAIIKKDLRAITSNKRLFSSIVIVPIILTVVLPSIFVLVARFSPDETDELKNVLELLPQSVQGQELSKIMIDLVINYIMPVFFLMIPIMTASIMAASSFVGEKEKHTLETLLYCPLSIKQIFRSKVLASFSLSMFVSFISFVFMIIVLELETYFLLGYSFIPGANWIIIILLLSPAISLIAVTLIVRGSAKAQSVEESQQGAVFLILPVILLAVGQFTGIMLVNIWILLVIGLLCALIAWLLLKKSAGKFTYEKVLR